MGPAEGLVQERHELRVVGERDLGRARMSLPRRDPGRDHVRVDAEGVHERPAAAACAVGLPEVADEDGRGVGGPEAVRVVCPARRDGAADHLDVRRGLLDRVVRAREQVLVRGRRDVVAGRAELRHPERVQVRLVADGHGDEVRERLDGRRGERRELRALCRVARRVLGVAVPDDEEEPQVPRVRRRLDVPQRVEDVRRELRQTPSPHGCDHDRVEAGATGGLDACRGRGRALLGERVVDDSDAESPAVALGRRRGRDRGGRGRERDGRIRGGQVGGNVRMRRGRGRLLRTWPRADRGRRSRRCRRACRAGRRRGSRLRERRRSLAAAAGGDHGGGHGAGQSEHGDPSRDQGVPHEAAGYPCPG